MTKHKLTNTIKAMSISGCTLFDYLIFYYIRKDGVVSASQLVRLNNDEVKYTENILKGCKRMLIVPCGYKKKYRLKIFQATENAAYQVSSEVEYIGNRAS